ncbi:Gfo/Idh/MocA family oxidoreductase [uncultured Victivallis sp.]|uniref:Gfo/Idh/MocA family oxidoreductase n=1 Tax=uncultured Victivallis sp. TaxID=354118 RepID=UPI0025EF6E12|nr:Gfo/Idh/MocA family oxidoreductase [uncultured Victivallis sp.]
MKKRYCIVGTGGRSEMYIKAILNTFPEQAELVGLCDSNQKRMDFYNKVVLKKYCNNHPDLPTYKAQEFDRMIAECKPDTVIVTSMDRTHHKYTCRAMELGCDVISEKPMTIDAEKCQQIIDTKKRTGKNLTVTFNYRYAPRNSKVKEVLKSGVVGEITSVHFEWLLDTCHGADYFRRWHRNKVNSGGLMVHKATHHFDLVNWWIDSEPVTVFAMGDLKFYGKINAEKRGITEFYSRARGSKIAEKDPFALHVKESDENLMGLYYNAEDEDGYYRDQSVFGDGISIEDNMGVMVRYKNNVVMTYCLCAHCPWEGYRVVFNGTKGRLEFNVVENSYCKAEGEDFNSFGMRELGQDRSKLVPEIIFQPHWGKPQVIEYSVDSLAGHGGGDERLLRHLFVGVDDDPLGLAADYVDGAKSILTGIGANLSMQTGLPVKVQELIHW